LFKAPDAVVHLLLRVPQEIEFEKLLDQLIRLEGSWLNPYRDADGNLILAHNQYVQAAGLDDAEITILEADVRRIVRELQERWPGVDRVGPVRKRVLIHMAFNLGVAALMGMLRFVSAVRFRYWDAAADEMTISPWAKQHRRRATVLAAMMRTGEEPPIIERRRTKA
jgi:hypothetical protein